MVSNQNKVLNCHPSPRHQMPKITGGTVINNHRPVASQKVINRTTNRANNIQVHHLIVDCFFPGSLYRDTKRLIIRHLDGNTLNNKPENLQILSRRYAQLNKIAYYNGRSTKNDKSTQYLPEQQSLPNLGTLEVWLEYSE